MRFQRGRRSALLNLMAAMMASLSPTVLLANEASCGHCRRQSLRCCKVCRLVREDRKITTTCWGMKSEDFCVPGPATPDCQHCDTVCANCEKNDGVVSAPKRLIWTQWIPGCGQEIYTRNKLMKKTVTRTVPGYKWVVETVCPACMAAMEPLSVPKGTQIPRQPSVSDAVVIAWTESSAEPK